MQPIVKHFIRGQSGSWECVCATEFDGPAGRVHVRLGQRFFRDTLYIGVDLAKLLDEQYSKASYTRLGSP